MRRSVLSHSGAAWLTCVLFAALAVPLNAQVAGESNPQHPSRLGYDKAHEITLSGTIQSVVSHSAPGVPTGLHLLVAGPQGTVDAHLGPYVSKDVKAALENGTPVEIVGATERIHGKSYLLARELVVDGHTVTIRSKNGFLLMGQSVRASRNNEQSRLQLNGGAQ